MKIQLSEHFTYPKLLRFVFPSVVMMIFTSIYGVVDGLFISNFVGKTAFAAVNLIYPYLMMLGCLGFVVGTGGSALVSKTMGEGDSRRANQYFSMLIWVTIAFGAAITALGFLTLRPVSVLLGAEGEMVDQCVFYGGIIMAAQTAFLLQVVFQSFFVTAERPQLGPLRRNEEALEYHLEEEGGLGGHDNPAVEHALVHHLPLRPQEDGHRPQGEEPQRRNCSSEGDGHPDEHGKILIRPAAVPLAHGLGHQGAAPGAHHKPQAPQHHQVGIDEVDGGKGGLSHKVGDKQPVHHAVDGGENHHYHRRKDKPQQLWIGKVFRKLDFHTKKYSLPGYVVSSD